MASLRKALSSSSRVTMMEKISARESCRSRSARVSASFTSYFLLVSASKGDISVSRTSSRFIVAEIVVLGT